MSRFGYIGRILEDEEVAEKVNSVFSPIAESLIWADSDSVSCPWCGQVANRVKEKAYLGRDDRPTTYYPKLNHSFVWRCKPCRRYFSVFDSVLSEGDIDDSLIFERWYNNYRPKPEDVLNIISAIMNDADTEEVRELVTYIAGRICEVKRRRHTPSCGDYSDRMRSSCWCENDKDDGFRSTGQCYKQTERFCDSPQ